MAERLVEIDEEFWRTNSSKKEDELLDEELRLEALINNELMDCDDPSGLSEACRSALEATERYARLNNEYYASEEGSDEEFELSDELDQAFAKMQNERRGCR
ncbi:MAG TPA: hypothetical protein VF152_02615 [Acidimicrobiia bacterium]